MNRRELLQRIAALSATLPFFAQIGCAPEDEGLYWDFDVKFEGKVVVIGAGAAGLAAGYLLYRYGIDFEILEASPVIGGRVRRDTGLADFPIDLGAEWIHEDPVILSELVDDPDAPGSISVIPYVPQTVSNAKDGRLTKLNVGSNYYGDTKFEKSTWFGFLDEHIAPDFRDRIRTGCPVVSVVHGDDGVELTCEDGSVIEADRVLVTVPIKVLQDERIAFDPPLSDRKRDAIDAVGIPNGIKVFLRFSENFYPDITLVGPLTGPGALEKIYYNAAFGKQSDDNVLALFWVSDDASELTDLEDDDSIVTAVLKDLDDIFDGQATPAFQDAVVQNWSAEPHIRGAYSYSYRGKYKTIVDALQESVNDRLYFAGEALSRDNSATVPGAMQSAYDAVRELLET
jgi:monoamine oxidase